MTNHYNNYNLSTSLVNKNGDTSANLIGHKYINEDDTNLPKLSERKKSSKKSVSFSENIDIETIENWKKYNVDTSKETEYYKLLNEIKKYKVMKKKSNDCCCEIF